MLLNKPVRNLHNLVKICVFIFRVICKSGKRFSMFIYQITYSFFDFLVRYIFIFFMGYFLNIKHFIHKIHSL